MNQHLERTESGLLAVFTINQRNNAFAYHDGHDHCVCIRFRAKLYRQCRLDLRRTAYQS